MAQGVPHGARKRVARKTRVIATGLSAGAAVGIVGVLASETLAATTNVYGVRTAAAATSGATPTTKPASPLSTAPAPTDSTLAVTQPAGGGENAGSDPIVAAPVDPGSPAPAPVAPAPTAAPVVTAPPTTQPAPPTTTVPVPICSGSTC